MQTITVVPAGAKTAKSVVAVPDAAILTLLDPPNFNATGAAKQLGGVAATQ